MTHMERPGRAEKNALSGTRLCEAEHPPEAGPLYCRISCPTVSCSIDIRCVQGGGAVLKRLRGGGLDLKPLNDHLRHSTVPGSLLISCR